MSHRNLSKRAKLACLLVLMVPLTQSVAFAQFDDLNRRGTGSGGGATRSGTGGSTSGTGGTGGSTQGTGGTGGSTSGTGGSTSGSTQGTGSGGSTSGTGGTGGSTSGSTQGTGSGGSTSGTGGTGGSTSGSTSGTGTGNGAVYTPTGYYQGPWSSGTGTGTGNGMPSGTGSGTGNGGQPGFGSGYGYGLEYPRAGTGSGTGTGNGGVDMMKDGGFASVSYRPESRAALDAYVSWRATASTYESRFGYYSQEASNARRQRDNALAAFDQSRAAGARIAPNANAALTMYLDATWRANQISDYYNPERQGLVRLAEELKKDLDVFRSDSYLSIPIGAAFDGLQYWAWQKQAAESTYGYYSAQATLAREAYTNYESAYSAQVNFGRRLFNTRQDALMAYNHAAYNENLAASQHGYYSAGASYWRAQKELFQRQYNSANWGTGTGNGGTGSGGTGSGGTGGTGSGGSPFGTGTGGTGGTGTGGTGR